MHIIKYISETILHIKIIIEEYFSLNIFKKNRLMLLDETFPNIRSPFRITEFNYYLNKFPSSQLYSSAPDYYNYKKKYLSIYPKNKSRIFHFESHFVFPANLAYVIFLHNIISFLPFLEKRNIPFVFELYPGGYFQINNERSDSDLKRVFNSPLFRHVIVTQKITYDYLIEKNFCNRDKITFIYGGVLPLDSLHAQIEEKKEFPQNKETFDICFVANRYLPKGEDKGYDIFIDISKKLLQKYPYLRFHVVGDYNEKIIDIEEIKNQITFYGTQDTKFFPSFYSKMDLFLSPNRNNTLLPGAFDGFPTGACIEASACGVALCVTDPVNLNLYYRNREDMLIINHDIKSIYETVEWAITNTRDLYELAKKGQATTMRIFDERVQMEPRINQIEKAYNIETKLKRN